MSTGITDVSAGWANIVPVNSKGDYVDSGVVGFNDGVLSLLTEQNQLKAYNTCSPLKAIIQKRAKAFNNGVVSIVDDNDKEVTSAKAKEILAKLSDPNPMQNTRQFMAQQNIYIDVFGYCLVLKTRPVGFSSITNLWNIPTWMLDPVYTNNWIYETTIKGILSSFKFTFGGSIIELQPDDFDIILDDGFGTESNLNMLIPDSRLVGNDLPVSTIISAYKATNTLINKKGAIGILSNKTADTGGSLPMKEGEKQALQQEFRRYGITGQEWQIIVTESNLEWQPMSMSVKDMMILESKADAVMALCDSYGYPYRLLAQEKSASYNDVSEFRKDFYSDTIIPESLSRWEQRSEAWLEPGMHFKCDYSQLPALQDDKQKSATARKTNSDAVEKMFKNNWVTLDRSRILMGEEPINDAFGKMYYWQLLDAGFSFGNTTLNGGDNQAVAGGGVAN